MRQPTVAVWWCPGWATSVGFLVVSTFSLACGTEADGPVAAAGRSPSEDGRVDSGVTEPSGTAQQTPSEATHAGEDASTPEASCGSGSSENVADGGGGPSVMAPDVDSGLAPEPSESAPNEAEPTDGGPGEGSTEDEPGAVVALDAGADGGNPLQAAGCAQWCELRQPKVDDNGYCSVDYGGASPCVEACQEREASSSLAALEACIVDDYLCYITLDDCTTQWQREHDCDAWCAFRDEQPEDSGFCSPTLEGSPDPGCSAVCNAALRRELDNVEECIKTDPMCFRDLAECAQQ